MFSNVGKRWVGWPSESVTQQWVMRQLAEKEREEGKTESPVATSGEVVW